MRVVRVDLNNRERDGLVVGALRRFSDARVGNQVILEDAGEEKTFSAVVVDIDQTSRKVYFAVDWQGGSDASPTAETLEQSKISH